MVLSTTSQRGADDELERLELDELDLPELDELRLAEEDELPPADDELDGIGESFSLAQTAYTSRRRTIRPNRLASSQPGQAGPS